MIEYTFIISVLTILFKQNIYLFIVNCVCILILALLMLVDHYLFVDLVNIRGGDIPNYNYIQDRFVVGVCTSVLVVALYTIGKSHLKFSHVIYFPIFPIIKVKGSLVLSMGLMFLIISVLIVFGKKGFAGTLSEGLLPLFLISCGIASGENRKFIVFLLFTFSVVTAILLSRTAFLSSVIFLCFLAFQGCRVPKIKILIGFAVGIFSIFILGVYRFGIDAILAVAFSGNLLNRFLSANLAGAMSSSMYFLSEWLGASVEAKLAIFVGYFIPLPTVLLPSDFVSSSTFASSIPGGGETMLVLSALGGFGIMFCFLYFRFFLQYVAILPLRQYATAVWFSLFPDFLVYSGKLLIFYWVFSLIILDLVSRVKR